MANDLYASATREDVERYFKDLYNGTDAVVDDSAIDEVLTTIQSQLSWRRSLPIEQQLELNQTPVVTGPQRLDQDNVPVGVTVVDPGKEQANQSGETPQQGE